MSRGTIVFLEDHTDTRVVLTRLLGEWGFNVHAAGWGKEAEALAESLDGSFDLLITDVVLPDCNGADLARRFQDRWGCAVLILTAGGMPRDVEHFRRLGLTHWLIKPVAADVLLTAIQRALRNGRPAGAR